MAKQELTIDVDQVIESYNQKNPSKLPMTRRRLAERLGVNPQIFSDWKRGKTPKWAFIVKELMNVGKCNVDKFIFSDD